MPKDTIPPHAPRHLSRDHGLDVARGIAIVAVVAGHIFPDPAKSMIYVFHMPFFFFVGGHLFRSSPDGPLLLRRFRQLIVPYLVFLLLFSLPNLIAPLREAQLSEALWRIRQLALGGEKLVSPLTVFWFPTCYFLTVVIYNALSRRLSPRAIWVASAGLLTAAYANQLLFPDAWLPWALNVCAMSIPMLHIGVTFGERIFRPDRQLLWACAVIALATLAAVALVDLPTMTMKRAAYGVPLLTLLAALACTTCLAAIGGVVASRPGLATPAIACGVASMTIMYLHMPVQLTLLAAGLDSPWGRFILTVVLCVAAHRVFDAFAPTRVLLLGKPGRAPKVDRPAQADGRRGAARPVRS
ncbi:acyltransferase family protein [Sagittula sp. S175]|uniref:acyltransferase family protein n=1 Tax=Sagittula sp. S175 TaxID=3415129 RepID=UPI003C7E49E4